MTSNKTIALVIASVLILLFSISNTSILHSVKSNISMNMKNQNLSLQDGEISHNNNITWIVEWNQTYGGYTYDSAESIIVATDGGYVIAGWTRSYGAGYTDMWLVKINSTGHPEWNRTYGGVDYDYASSIIATSDGGYALAGYTKSYGAGGSDMWLVKTNVNGHIEWNQSYGGVDLDTAYSLVATSDGGYALAGRTDSYPGYRSMFLVKTNSNGLIEWSRSFGDGNYDEAYSVITTPDDGYLLAGTTEYYGAGHQDMWLVKTNATGHAEWNRTYGGKYHDGAYSLVSTSDGGYALAGYSDSYEPTDHRDMWLVKTNATGHEEWNQTFGRDASAYSVIATADGGYALAGDIWPGAISDVDMLFIKANSTGHTEFSQNLAGILVENANSVVGTSDGGYILAGSTESSVYGTRDMWLVKIGLLNATDSSLSENSNLSETITSSINSSFDIIAIVSTFLTITVYYKRRKR